MRLSALLFAFVSLVVAIPHDLEARDDVLAAELVIIALKASAFCSSFVPIKDITSTSTITGTNGVTTITSCYDGGTKQKRTLATTSTTKTTTPQAATPAVAAATKSSTSAVKCNVGKAELKGFACSVITQACNLAVKPKTTSVSHLTSCGFMC